MSQLNVVRRCYNCGTILQSDDPKKPGFVDKTLLESSQSAVLFCEKCWKEQRYNIAPREPTVDPQFLSMLNDAQASDATIVYVVDLFSFEASFIIPITQAIEGLHVLVIANKRDLLPRKMSDALLREYVAHRFRVARLSVTADDVVLTSLTSSADIKAIADRIETLRRRHDVYIIGAINAGKTLFLSSFLRSYSNASHFNITTANYPGTTIRVMFIFQGKRKTPGGFFLQALIKPLALSFRLTRYISKSITAIIRIAARLRAMTWVVSPSILFAM